MIEQWMLELARKHAAQHPSPDARYHVTATALDGRKQYLSPTGRWITPQRTPEGWLLAGTWSPQEAATLLVGAQVPFGHVRGLEAAHGAP